jgi:hypothetical protein
MPFRPPEYSKNALLLGIDKIFQGCRGYELLGNAELEEPRIAPIPQSDRVQVIIPPPPSRFFIVLAADLEGQIPFEKIVDAKPGFTALKPVLMGFASAIRIEFAFAEYFGFKQKRSPIVGPKERTKLKLLVKSEEIVSDSFV